jgi:AcrR family transcriptional regulator/DNA-binding transcriptional ArsR family regulator
MAGRTATVTDPRTQDLVQRIAALDADAGRREAVALGLVDSLLEREGETLAAVLDALRDARARADGDQELVGWLDAAIAVAHWGLERAPSPAAVAPGTQSHDFLRVLDGVPQLGSAELRRRLEVDETQVSRTGRRLLESGLVTRRKVGRQVFWKLTPRGQRALEEAPAPQRPRNSEFWQEALRRGFWAASGDVPGEPREVDPTRERIIVSTLGLHVSQGIQATTWEEIAGEADVPVATIRALFPAQEDLVRSCGEHFLESLRLPPADQTPAVFAGAASEHERIHRLVETFFSVYERGADGITVARRERDDLPPVDESLHALDDTFDALVAESLRPLRPDGVSIASLRALTDLEVWRTLRDQGVAPDAAVDQASAAVERWLEARPAR